MTRDRIEEYDDGYDSKASFEAAESDTEETLRVNCPDCPDGYVWTEQGPTDLECPTCHGKAWVYP